MLLSHQFVSRQLRFDLKQTNKKKEKKKTFSMLIVIAKMSYRDNDEWCRIWVIHAMIAPTVAP